MIARLQLSTSSIASSLGAVASLPAWEVFAQSQLLHQRTEGWVLQTEHARIAGRIARSLCPEIFGDLPREVLEAVDFHDEGWGQSDREQLASLGQKNPRPFLEFAPGEETPSWQRSLQLAESKDPLTRLLISRHFCALAESLSPRRTAFLESETRTKADLEQQLGVPPETLKRWTDALGFCDLLSLYLCCGMKIAARFALAHPAEPCAARAQQVLARWDGEDLVFSLPIFRPNTRITGQGLRIEEPGKAASTFPLAWSCMTGG